MTVPLQDVQQRLIASRQKQAYYDNLKEKALPELQLGQIVKMKKLNENIWTEAVCKKMIGPQSYAVVSGNPQQSHAKDGCQVLTRCASPTKNSEGPTPVSNNPSTTALPADLASSSTFTRSGRTVRPLVRFQDYKTSENLRVLSSSLYNCIWGRML